MGHYLEFAQLGQMRIGCKRTITILKSLMLVNYGAEYVACDNTDLCRQYAAKQQEVVKYEQMAAKARFELLELWAQIGPGDSETPTNLKTLKKKASTLIQSQTTIPIRTVLADARNKQLENKLVAFGDKTSRFVNDLFKAKPHPSHDIANSSFDIENFSDVEEEYSIVYE